MAGVGCQLQWEFVAHAADEGALLSQVVFHVAGALGHLLDVAALELCEELLVGLADDVDEHVEAAPVGHAHHRAGHVVVGCCTEHCVDQWDGALSSFYAEALLPDVFRAEEGLEGFSGVEAAEDVALLIGLDVCVRSL